jgi:hypothetical protein
MGYIEHAHIGSHCLVLVKHAVMLDGHLPATEVCEAGARFFMGGVER